MRIGLFGGSFNPPHEGHRLAAETALRRLGLDRIWWLVTPGNPLKDNHALPSQDTRLAACRAMLRNPRMVVTGFESEIGVRYTSDTIDFLKQRRRGVRFVWIMGADSLAGFHRWRNWRSIANALPLVIVDRPGSTLRAATAAAARSLSASRVSPVVGAALAFRRPPAWTILYGKRMAISSTDLRKRPIFVNPSRNQG